MTSDDREEEAGGFYDQDVGTGSDKEIGHGGQLHRRLTGETGRELLILIDIFNFALDDAISNLDEQLRE